MSTLNVATVKSNTSGPPSFQNTSGTEIGRLCRAWVNFSGAGTVAIRAQFNVSSITDNGVGDFTVNFTTAMTDSSYTVSGSASDAAVAPYTAIRDVAFHLSSSVRIDVWTYQGNRYDSNAVCINIFR